jgi:hypothetical protein
LNRCLLCGWPSKRKRRNSTRYFAAFAISEQWSTNLDFLNPLITTINPNSFEIRRCC